MPTLSRQLRCSLAALAYAIVVAVGLPSNVFAAVAIPLVLVGRPGNLPDTRYNPSVYKPNGWDGGVDQSFLMGQTEVTNAQYVDFLNAAAAKDPLRLYDEAMASSTLGGIVRSGVSGSYRYAVKEPAVGHGPAGTDYTYDNKPVNFVSWYDSVRFINWLNNGQGPGDTETGAYTLLGDAPVPTNADEIVRNPGARWFLPSRDEWYKAAFYDPIRGEYFNYPTRSDDAPDNSLPSADSGNSANYAPLGVLTTEDEAYPFTDVGAYRSSPGPFGTFDQGGNAAEWSEYLYESKRGSHGGNFARDAPVLAASRFGVSTPREAERYGFRVAASLAVLPGNFDADLDVDADDLALWRENFAKTSNVGDADGDNDADGADFLLWQRHLGTPTAAQAAATVPEPTAGTIFVLHAFAFAHAAKRPRLPNRSRA